VDLPGLAARTKNFSGAEIEGLVKSAGSFALGPRIAVGNGSIALTTSSAKGDNKSAAADEKTPDPFLVKQEHFEQALEEVHPAFGTHEDDLQVYIQGGIMDWCVDPLTPDPREEILETTRFFLKPEGKSRLSTGGFLMLGLPGSGKTTLSADIGLTLASAGDCSFVKRLGFDQLSLLSESRKRDEIIRTFAEARQCKTALIILDDLDAILAHNRRTHQFSMEMMSTLQGAMTRLPSLPPPLRGTTAVLASPTTGVESKEAVAAVAVRGATHQNNKLMVLATCSLDFQTILQEIGLGAFFGWSTELPVIHNSAAFLKVAASVAPLHGEPQVERASSHSWPVKFPLGIRDVLLHLTPDL
jgi:SpoVK/Ycf46/Vps4 family AAA+-type ATPase